MRLFFSLLLCLSLFFQFSVIPVNAVETLAPQSQGIHVQLLQVEWGPMTETRVIPPPDYFALFGQFVGGWSAGALAYWITWITLNTLQPLLGTPSAVRDMGAMTVSVLANASFIWLTGNLGWGNQGLEGDFAMTLAGVLVGQSLYVLQPDLIQNNQNWGFLNYFSWGFSSSGGVIGYQNSLHFKD
ncbi:MAG: hypothetical protein AB7I41_15680 [Candidatus Sericytochromatia bacterium]